jgi:hypothetical protein
MNEYLRPWKLLTLVGGISILIYAGKLQQLPDRHIWISVVMAVLTYLTAPWAVRVFVQRRWLRMPLALLAIWFCVGGSYAAWNAHYGPEFSDFMRHAGTGYAWLSLYLFCGLLWL